MWRSTTSPPPLSSSNDQCTTFTYLAFITFHNIKTGKGNAAEAEAEQMLLPLALATIL